MSCVFCKIATGEIPAHKLYEDDEFIVILDRLPSNPGHSLIIPKTHAQDVFALDEGKIGRAFALAGRVAARVKDSLGCEGVNILQNNGEPAGQTVLHFHVHVIPRHKNDGALPMRTPHEPPEEELRAVLEKVRL